MSIENNRELWDLFTAKQEYGQGIKDMYNRHPYFASKNRNIFKPVVSEYLLKNGLQPKYPDGRKFVIALSHDVDYLYEPYFLKTLARHSIDAAKSLLSLNFKSFNNTLNSISKNEVKTSAKSTIRKRNPAWQVGNTISINKKYNAKSSFYFLSLTTSEADFNYEVSEIADVFQEIENNNCEIGLHGGHLAYNNLQKITEEKERLEKAIGKKVTGYRNHFLRFETPNTWEYLEKANFKYDTTFGYADCVGFRNGTCHPFQPFSNSQDNFLNITELPLIIMDGTLTKYMNLNEKEQFNVCKNIIDTVEKNNGVLTLLWHNNLMDGNRGEFYNALLKYAFEKNAWITTSNEIVNWWQENNYSVITKNILQELKDKLKD